MLKYVIFDFDGTLADSKLAFLSSWNILAKKHNFKRLQLDQLNTMKNISIWERSKLLNFPMHKLPVIIPQLYKLYRDSIKRCIHRQIY